MIEYGKSGKLGEKKQHYLTIYEDFMSNPSTELIDLSSETIPEEKEKGIKHFKELKKSPRLLNYTRERLKVK